MGDITQVATFFGRGCSTVSAALDLVASRIVVILRADHIKLPTNEEIINSAQIMLRDRGMPAAFAALDGKHFPVIGCDKVDQLSVKNYKGFKSLCVLGIADTKYRLIWLSDVFLFTRTS